MNEFFSYIICALGILGGSLNFIAAVRRQNGKRGVRLFSALACAVAAVVYASLIAGYLSNPLPSDLVRPLVAFILTGLVAYGIVEA